MDDTTTQIDNYEVIRVADSPPKLEIYHSDGVMMRIGYDRPEDVKNHMTTLIMETLATEVVVESIFIRKNTVDDDLALLGQFCDNAFGKYEGATLPRRVVPVLSLAFRVPVFGSEEDEQKERYTTAIASSISLVLDTLNVTVRQVHYGLTRYILTPSEEERQEPTMSLIKSKIPTFDPDNAINASAKSARVKK